MIPDPKKNWTFDALNFRRLAMMSKIKIIKMIHKREADQARRPKGKEIVQGFVGLG